MLDQLLGKIDRRDKVNFITSFVVGVIVHLFVFTNSFINHDGIYFNYSEQNMSGSGRFMLSYLAGISSFFNLNYLNGILSILYIAFTLTLLIKMFNIQSKVSVFAVIVSYVAFPSIAATFAYMFVADAYFLANLLIVLSIYILRFKKFKVLNFVIATLLVYVTLATYQSNLGFFITLVLLLVIRDLFLFLDFNYRYYIKTIVTVVTGFVIYFIHYKIYELMYGITSYQGLDQAGKLSLDLIIDASAKSIKTTVKLLISPLTFSNIYEYLNIIFIATIIIVGILYVRAKLINVKQALVILLLFCFLPFTVHIIYFASPGVFYHLLMEQHFAIIFILVIAVTEQYYSKILKKSRHIHTFAQILLLLIGFNLVLITNIYYEQFEEFNTKTYATMTQIASDIRHTDGYDNQQKIVVLGTLEEQVNTIDQYDLATPSTSGIFNSIIYDSSTFVVYMDKLLNLQFSFIQDREQFMSTHNEQINHMPNWPAADAIQIIDNTIVIKLSEDVQ